MTIGTHNAGTPPTQDGPVTEPRFADSEPSARVSAVDIVTIPAAPVRPAGRRGSRARMALVAGMVLFFAGQAAFSVAVRRDWIPVADPVYGGKFGLLREHPEFFAPSGPSADRPVRVLALGSSRTQLGFDAGRFAGAVGPRTVAFNFGTPAGGPVTAALYWRRLLADGATPDCVFVEIHPGLVSQLTPPFEARWLWGERLRADEVAVVRNLGWPIASPPHLGWRGWTTAVYAYRSSFLNRYAPVLLLSPFGFAVEVTGDEFGYLRGLDLPPATRAKALERTRTQYAPVFPDYHVGGPGPAALRDVLALCRERGIRAALLVTPESTELRSWYGAAANDEFAAFARSLADEADVPLFDARGWVPDDGFADGHHMTTPGAAAFTDRLAREAGPWIAQTPGVTPAP
ncbi:hypothetical protein [Fimbriiglobus ruber]|uniref:Uncharacterized protein n=1 Tax=Fimbriiglobus ruber TaxID=1908690 RepID=A0A225DNC2_9BACT|nr:hypothetical protein [Fimbriiglobus ruber]OWK42970.1 hypothetical protein FRUB_02569 [Fimbriiglobus ruber]